MKRHIISACILAAVLLAAGCSGKEDQPAGTLLKMTAVLGAYTSPTGTVVPSWKDTDNLFVKDVTTGSSAKAKPSMSGTNSSMFALKMSELNDKDMLIASYPSSDIIVSASEVSFKIPASQSGTQTVPIMIGSTEHKAGSASGDEVKLEAVTAFVGVNVSEGNFEVTKVVLTTNGGESIAGNAKLDLGSNKVTALTSSITVTPTKGISCAEGGATIPIMVAPGELSRGFKVTVTTSKGENIVSDVSESVSLRPGQTVLVGSKSANTGRRLIACGSNKVYMFNADKLNWGDIYSKSLRWAWDCTTIQGTLAGAKSSSHIDDVVMVNGNRQMLVTCSNNNGWCALLEPDFDVNGKAQLLFWTNKATNAHSAEMLPDGYVVVACSTDGGDCIQLYDISKSNTILASYPLTSAHGIVWNDKTKRLYAIGGTTLQVYTWDTSSHTLKIEKEISTKSYVTGLHDMTLVDENTLVIGGGKAALFDVNTEKFTSLTWFASSATNGIKSINYNPETNEVFYTFATEGTSEGSYTWSSHRVRYTSNPSAVYDSSSEKFYIVADINMYKVRVLNW